METCFEGISNELCEVLVIFEKEGVMVCLQQLKKYFFDEYGGFADKRIKNIDKGDTYIIDDRTKGDEDSRGRLFSWYCSILLQIKDIDNIIVELCGDVPKGNQIEEIVKEYPNVISMTEKNMKIKINEASFQLLSKIGIAFQAIVAPGKHYSVPSYKYVCPRIKASLDEVRHKFEIIWNS